MKKNITPELTAKFREAFADDTAMRAAEAAAARTDIKQLVYLPNKGAELSGPFAVEIKTHGITAQMRSGRCWMFAVMNMMREIVMEKCGLDAFELSGNYLAFYDKLEKSNNLLQMAIDTADKPLDDRAVEYVLEGFHDGGYWQMAVDLVKKYGIVPLKKMPETYASTHTGSFLDMLDLLLKKDIALLRKCVQEGKDPYAMKEEMLKEIYRIECIVFGEPVTEFTFEYKDKDGVFHCDRNITPLEFYDKYIGLDPDEYVTICSELTHKKPAGTHYRFHYVGNMQESDVDCINVDPAELEALCIASLKDGTPVWFCNDAGQYGDRSAGVWDPASFAYKEIFGADFFMERTARLEHKAGFSSHAMLLTGVNFDENGTPDRWKIENSWGGEVGEHGYFVCSEAYFKEYVYEAVINKKYLTEEQKALFESTPVVLKPWEI